MFRVHTPIIRSIRCWVAAYGFLHRVFGWVVVLRAAASVVCAVRMVLCTALVSFLLLTPWIRFFIQSNISQNFMELHCSLPCPQQPATCSNSVPEQTSPGPQHVSWTPILISYIFKVTPWRFPHKNRVCTCPLSNKCRIPRQTHSSTFINKVIFGKQHTSWSSS